MVTFSKLVINKLLPSSKVLLGLLMPLKLQPYGTIEIRFIITYWLYAGPSCTICQVLVIRRTMQINSRPTEIIVFFGSKVVICVDDEFDWHESNYVRELWLGLGLYAYITQVVIRRTIVHRPIMNNIIITITTTATAAALFAFA